jgi:hypothetical protein
MLLGLLLGFGVGLNIGLWLGSYLQKRWMKPLIEDYKKSVEYWYEAYMKELRSGREQTERLLNILKR